MKHWDSCDRYPVEDWKFEVSLDETRLGYKDWVKAKIDGDQRRKSESYFVHKWRDEVLKGDTLLGCRDWTEQHMEDEKVSVSFNIQDVLGGSDDRETCDGLTEHMALAFLMQKGGCLSEAMVKFGNSFIEEELPKCLKEQDHEDRKEAG